VAQDGLDRDAPLRWARPEDVIQTVMFLKLIIAGHSTLYITRAEGWFWRRPWPSPMLFGATFGTEIIGTLIAVYGLFIAPIGWEYALSAWLYALAWFLVNDAVKMLVKRILPIAATIPPPG
jgi:H+-transporting ATPase